MQIEHLPLNQKGQCISNRNNLSLKCSGPRKLFQTTPSQQLFSEMKNKLYNHHATCAFIAHTCNSDPLKTHFYMSLVVRKRDFGVSDLVRHKPGFAVTEDG